MNEKIREQQWVFQKTRHILRESGVGPARRFIESRGGAAKHESASREIARVAIARQKEATSGKVFFFPTLLSSDIKSNFYIRVYRVLFIVIVTRRCFYEYLDSLP